MQFLVDDIDLSRRLDRAEDLRRAQPDAIGDLIDGDPLATFYAAGALVETERRVPAKLKLFQ